MKCEKCDHGQMYKTKIFRLSKPLVTIGYIVLILAIIPPAVWGIMTVVGSTTTGAIVATEDLNIREQGVRKLENIKGLPKVVVIDFKDDGQVSATNLALVRNTDKAQVAHIIRTHQSSPAPLVAPVAAAGFVAFLGGTVTILCLLGSITSFIVGFLLIMKKNVWRCNHCDYIFDRA